MDNDPDVKLLLINPFIIREVITEIVKEYLAEPHLCKWRRPGITLEGMTGLVGVCWSETPAYTTKIGEIRCLKSGKFRLYGVLLGHYFDEVSEVFTEHGLSIDMFNKHASP